jgi:hypothetical protein
MLLLLLTHQKFGGQSTSGVLMLMVHYVTAHIQHINLHGFIFAFFACVAKAQVCSHKSESCKG